MEIKNRIAPFIFFILSLVISSAAAASSTASCTLNGNWNHNPGSAGTNQSCLSYVCCSKGSAVNWTAAVSGNASASCQRWGAAPVASCTDSNQEVYNRMTLGDMSKKVGAAAGFPASATQCRYDKPCDGE